MRKRLFSKMERKVCAAAEADECGAVDAAGSKVAAAGAAARTTTGVLAVAATLVAIAGCASSAPLRFYTLSAVAPAGVEAAPGAAAIRVGRVRIPAELDRMELVQRIDANRVSIVELDRWAAPLEDMVRRVLAADLQARAGTGSQGNSAAAPATVNVDIEEFTGDASCNVTLTASWELKTANAPLAGHATIRLPGSGGSCPASALPMPMSQAIAQLSEKILAPH